MKRKPGLAIFGGTFDPPHIGHLRVAASIVSQPWIKSLVIVPSWKPPYKGKITSFKKRCEMCENTFYTLPKFDWVESDIHSQYTYQTIRALIKHGIGPLYLFIGSDWDIYKFKNAKYILENCEVIYFRRNIQIDSRFIRAGKYIDISGEMYTSSTAIREMVKKGQNVTGLVSGDVEVYIHREGLYGAKD